MDDSGVISLAERMAKQREAGPVSEDGLALTFAERQADTLRFVADWNKWMCFDGVRWQRDSTLHVFDRVRIICREAADNIQQRGVKSAKTVAAVEKLARSDRKLAATAEQWDAEPMRLTAGNVTYDLTTGEGCNPDPLDYNTKITGCAMAPPGTLHPVWTAFLDRVLPDQDVQRFMQRYLGYCCTGDTREHAFIFTYGTGANGKSTFINTIARIFGDYATTAAMETFIYSPNERHSTDLAKLHGSRLVVALETQKGRRWDETKIKALTAGDRITARFMRQDFFDYTPTFKLLIGGNHRPRLFTVDEAMRRRLLLVPFAVQIPAAERDKELMAKLEAEHPAILRWCMDGCLQWQGTGLMPPASVLEATDAYFSDQDTIGQWLEECTYDAGPAAFTRSSVLFDSWKGWCEERNLKPGSTQSLSETLQARGYAKKREPGTGQIGLTRVTLKGV
jgi:putative DNA primase/helicase